MTSTGNDIVALGAINVDRTKQSDFYSKIIVDAEKALYDNALSGVLPLEHFVWLAWSVKESVYKFLQRHQHDLVFSPSKINVEQLTRGDAASNDQAIFDGVSGFGSHKMYSRSVVTGEYIFSVVNDEDDFAHIYSDVKRIGSTEPADQSAAVRDLVLHKLQELFPADRFKIEKSTVGFPVLFRNEVEADIPLSFAHHDHYVGYSFGFDALI